MLEGLEITIYNKLDVLNDNEEFRLDTEYYKKEYLRLYSKINNSPILEDVVYMSDLLTNGSFATVKKIMNYGGEKNIPFIRSGNCGETFINFNDLECISQESHINLPKSTTQLYDIMMARKGKIGGASIITEKEVDYNCSENVIKLSIKNKSKFNPFYFTIFFNGKYGLKQVERLSTGNVQPWVSIFQIKKLLIPELEKIFQKKIEHIVNKAYIQVGISQQTYAQAENILLAALGLADFTPSQEAVNIKNFSASFGTSGRLDAEYYQPKYEEVVSKIKNQNYDTLSNIVSIKKSIEPGSINYDETGLPFLRVADYSKQGITTPQKYLSDSFTKSSKTKIKDLKPKKGTILFSKDGSVGTAYHLREDYNGITSGAILHLLVNDKTKIIPEYLTLVLNSKLVQMQAERDAGGSIILHWRVSEIENVVVPIIIYDKQQEIAELIEKSFALKKQSEHLLAVAKTAVEMAIEQNESVAMAYINNEII